MSEKKPYEGARKWDAKNPEKRKYWSHRSRARSFIREVATLEDLEELASMIEGRKKQLKEGQ